MTSSCNLLENGCLRRLASNDGKLRGKQLVFDLKSLSLGNLNWTTNIYLYMHHFSVQWFLQWKIHSIGWSLFPSFHAIFVFCFKLEVINVFHFCMSRMTFVYTFIHIDPTDTSVIKNFNNCAFWWNVKYFTMYFWRTNVINVSEYF